MHQRVVEHLLEGRGDISRRVGRVKETGRGAARKARRDVWDVVVGVSVLVACERRVHRIDRHVGNVEHRNDDAAALERKRWSD